MKKPSVYYLQNRAIHKAREHLESAGIVQRGKSLEMARFLAGKLNLGIQSISRLSLSQRTVLIEKLIDMGARVKNPVIYESDFEAERQISGSREPRKITVLKFVTEDQLRMLDALAGQIVWRTPDGYLRFCLKLIKNKRPRNSKEVTKLRLALTSLLEQQIANQTSVQNQSVPGSNPVL